MGKTASFDDSKIKDCLTNESNIFSNNEGKPKTAIESPQKFSEWCKKSLNDALWKTQYVGIYRFILDCKVIHQILIFLMEYIEYPPISILK